MRVREEGYFHTQEQVRGHVLAALELADELELDPEDRATLLPAMLTLLSGKQVVFEAGAAGMLTLPPQNPH